MTQAPPLSVKKQFEIINLEGTVLALYSDANDPEKLYLSSFLKGPGEVYYATSRNLLKRFLDSEITINELFQLSESEFVRVTARNNSQSFLKSSFNAEIFVGDKYYRYFPDHSKSKHFELVYG